MNAAADADPAGVAAFADAADAMRAAQRDALAGRGDGVAAALREVRSRTTELARRADRHLTERGRSSDLAALVERLTAVAGSGVATARLRDALLRDGDEALDEAPDDTTDQPHRPHEPAPAPAPKRLARSRGDRRADTGAAGEAARDAAEDRAATRRELVRAVADAERAQRTADHHVARAEHTLAEVTTKRELAEAAVRRAQADLDRATERAESAAATVAELRAVAAEHAAALAGLQARLAHLEP